MKTVNVRFLCCLTGTIFLAAGVIFFPRYISRSLDMRSFGQVEISKREDFSFLEQGSNEVFEAADAFQYLGREEENPTLLTVVKEPMQVNEDLLNEVYMQAMSASENGMIPWLGQDARVSGAAVYMDMNKNEVVENELYMNWTDYVQFAKYYSLAYESKENSNKKELLNFWYVRFSDEERFEYSFIVNAVNYEIYYAEIHNVSSQTFVDASESAKLYGWEENQSNAFMYDLGVVFGDGCANYYNAFGYDIVNQEYLYQKMNIVILYFEEGESLYIERSVSERSVPNMYAGVCVGFQDLIRWVRTLPEDE